MQEEKQYQNMVKTILPNQKSTNMFSGVMQEVNRMLLTSIACPLKHVIKASIGVNMIIATITAVVLGYYVGGHLFNDDAKASAHVSALTFQLSVFCRKWQLAWFLAS